MCMYIYMYMRVCVCVTMCACVHICMYARIVCIYVLLYIDTFPSARYASFPGKQPFGPHTGQHITLSEDSRTLYYKSYAAKIPVMEYVEFCER